MWMRKLILFGLCFCKGLYGLGQSFGQFDQLKRKADSAYYSKNYALSAKYYDQIKYLPDVLKSGISSTDYFDIACVYSLNKEKGKALDNLQKCFLVSTATVRKNPITLSHLISDPDLDYVRTEGRFTKLIETYYPKLEIEFALAKEVSYEQVLQYFKLHADDHEGETISVKDKIIFWQKNNASFDFNEKTKPLPPPRFEGLSNKIIDFNNCTFKLHFVWYSFNESDRDLSFEMLSFNQCKFDGRFIMHGMNFIRAPKIRKCNFAESFELVFKSEYVNDGGLTLEGNSFRDVNIGIQAATPIDFQIRDNSCSVISEFTVESNNIANGIFFGNKLVNTNMIVAINANVLKFEENFFNNLILQRTAINSEMDLRKSKLEGKLLLYHTYFSNEPVNDIDWKDLDSLRLGLLSTYYFYNNPFVSVGNQSIGRLSDFRPMKNDSNNFNSGEKDDDIANDQSFRELMGLYSMFLSLYKNKNDIESYNACFITIKELQSKRLKYLYESKRTFETYFSWKLSQLLKFYVRYGTNPARAIVISLYIIFLFGVFFFFFPSDWDTTSKRKLIQNFKDFIQKNDKGYVIPFFVLLGGFALSLANALTLSLNAFITLGFGNIPTHGVARYVCVIEGFMGWFLLSIFTVALINQVL